LADFISFFARNIMKKLDVNDYNLAHLTLVLLLHYLMKFRSGDQNISVFRYV